MLISFMIYNIEEFIILQNVNTIIMNVARTSNISAKRRIYCISFKKGLIIYLRIRCEQLSILESFIYIY